MSEQELGKPSSSSGLERDEELEARRKYEPHIRSQDKEAN